MLPGATVNLQVDAHDPDCASPPCTDGCGQYIRQDLSAWTALDGGTLVNVDNGISISPYTATADWIAPSVLGSYDIRISLSDSGSFLCGGRQTSTDTITIIVSDVVNQAPEISSLTATATQLLPGESTSLECIATDPDGDRVDYGWSTDIGSLTPSGNTAIFNGTQIGVASVRCTATDPGAASDQATLPISVSLTTVGARISGLATPQKVAVSSIGEIFIADRGLGGIAVSSTLNPVLGGVIRVDDLTSVAVDWSDHIMVGTRTGARVIDRSGATVRPLISAAEDSWVVDVAASPLSFRYAVLYRGSGRVDVFDAFGSFLFAFGTAGADFAIGELAQPLGLAALPDGGWAIADSGHGRVQIFDAAGGFVSGFGSFGQIVGVGADGAGRIYATDAFQSRVSVYTVGGAAVDILGGFGTATGELRTPTGVTAADTFGTVAVTSLNGGAVQLYRLDRTVLMPPTVSLSPADLSFSAQASDTISAPQSATLSNTGTDPVTLTDLSITGEYQLSSSCPDLLLPAAACQLQIRFAPKGEGSRIGSLEIASTAVASPHSLSIDGTGIAPPVPLASLTQSSMSFNSQIVGTTSGAQSLSLSNVGTGTLSISSITRTGDFAVASGCGQSLIAGASCQIDLYFSPTQTGERSGTLSILSDSANSPQQVSLSGTGLGVPIASLAPSTLDLGSVDVGTSTGPGQLTLSNPGADTLVLSSITTSGDFSVTSSCGSSVAARSSCPLWIDFTPTAGGDRSGLLTVVSNDPAGATSANLSGYGIGQPMADLDPASLSFGFEWFEASSQALTATLTNIGEGPLSIGSATISGTARSDFKVTINRCSGRVLEVGSNCAFGIVFTPTDEGDRRAELVVETDDSIGTHVSNLFGQSDFVETILGDGSDPSAASLCPGDLATLADAFSLVTEIDTDSVEWLQVELGNGNGPAIGLVEVLDERASNVLGSAGVSVDRATVWVGLPVDTITTRWTVRLTPAAHADMPAPPGSTYWINANVGAFASQNLSAGSDRAGRLVTIDNLSTASPTWVDGIFSRAGNLLSWVPPDDSDLDSLLLLRTSERSADAPAEGESYLPGDKIGKSIVLYVGTDNGTIDGAVTQGLNYYYSLFARDSCGNWSKVSRFGPVNSDMAKALSLELR